MKRLLTLILMVAVFSGCVMSAYVYASDVYTISGNEISITAESSDIATYIVDDASGKPGETVSVSLHYKTPIAANIAAVVFDFDSTLIEFTDFTFDVMLQPYINTGLSNYNIEKKTVVVLFNGNVLYDGVIGTASFKIKEDAPLGVVNIGARPSTKTESMTVVESVVVGGEIQVYSDVVRTENNGVALIPGFVASKDELCDNLSFQIDASNSPNTGVKSDNTGFFRLEDAIYAQETIGDINKKIYDVSLLSTDYLEYMRELEPEVSTSEAGVSPAPTNSYDYEITAVNIRDNEDNQVDYLVNGGVLQSVTVESNGVDDSVILAIAEYNGYTITSLTSYDIVLNNNKDVVMTNYSLSGITEDTSFKIFVWDSYWGTAPMAASITLFPDNGMDIFVNFLYDNVYVEKTLKRGETITAQVGVRSTKWWTQYVNLYVALYDDNSKLISIANAHSDIISNGNYQFVDIDIPISQVLPSGYTIKTYVWDGQTLKPFLPRETIISTEDYHSDDIQNARYVDITKPVSGIVNSDTDKDCIKFIPNETQNCLIQLYGNEQFDIKIYNSDLAMINASDYYFESTGILIEQNLIKGEMYYIEISGNAQEEYMLMVTPNSKATDNVQITGNGIVAIGQAESMKTLNAKLLSSSGNLVSTQEFYVDETGNYNVSLPINLLSGEYYFAISNENVVQKLWSVNAVINNCTFDTVQNEYCIVPITVANANNLENINLSVSYAITDFELYDACDMTETIENSVMEISDKSINIISVQPSYIVFKSLKTELPDGDEIINIVKLKAKQSALTIISVCAYTIQ